MSGQDMRTLMEAIDNVSVDTVDRITVNLTGSQWDLFDSTMDTAEAAKALNHALEKHVNLGMSREEVTAEVEKVMDMYSAFGARDTEPRAILSHLLDQIYNSEEIFEGVVRGPWRDEQPEQTGLNLRDLEGNKVGPVDTSKMKEISLHHVFGGPEYAAIKDAGFSFEEKPGYMSDISREINVRDVATIEQVIGRKLNSYQMSDILNIRRGEYFPQSTAKFENLKADDETFILWDNSKRRPEEINNRYLVNRTGASSYIRMWARLVA